MNRIEDRISDIYNKLDKLCDDERLFYEWTHKSYPMTGMVRKIGRDKNQVMMEGVVEEVDSVGAATFIFDEELLISTDDSFIVSDEVFSKLKNLFKKLHYECLQRYFKMSKEMEAADEKTD